MVLELDACGAVAAQIGADAHPFRAEFLHEPVYMAEDERNVGLFVFGEDDGAGGNSDDPAVGKYDSDLLFREIAGGVVESAEPGVG